MMTRMTQRDAQILAQGAKDLWRWLFPRRPKPHPYEDPLIAVNFALDELDCEVGEPFLWMWRKGLVTKDWSDVDAVWPEWSNYVERARLLGF